MCCGCVCVCACARVCVCACARLCAVRAWRVRARACVCVLVCVWACLHMGTCYMELSDDMLNSFFVVIGGSAHVSGGAVLVAA